MEEVEEVEVEGAVGLHITATMGGACLGHISFLEPTPRHWNVKGVCAQVS